MRHRALLAVALALGASRAAAQNLPAWRPTTPIIATRSVLGFLPVEPGSDRWRWEVALDYTAASEVARQGQAGFTLDTELLRLEARAVVPIDPRWFLAVDVGVGNAAAGFLDRPIDWWHRVFGFKEGQRDSRPTNEFAYDLALPDGTTISREAGGLWVNDLRATLGFRHTRAWQTTLLVGLPISTAPEGYGLTNPSVGVVTSWRAVPGERWVVEGSAGVGATPTGGELKAYQRTVQASGSVGTRFRFWGQQWAYANVLAHSATHRGTSLGAIDRPAVELDFGFLLRPGNGPEITAGLVEDLHPFGAAVDLVFRLGARW